MLQFQSTRLFLTVISLVSIFTISGCSKGNESNTTYYSPLLNLSPSEVSIEQKRLESSAKAAFDSGRRVLIHATAAWCPPCLDIEDDIANDPEVKAQIEKRFVRVQYESMHLQTVSRTLSGTFQKVGLFYYPGFVAFDPRTGKWEQITPYYTDYTGKGLLKQIEKLETQARAGGILKVSLPKFRADLASGNKFDSEESLGNVDNLLSMLLVNVALELPPAQAHAVLKEIDTALKQYPDRFDLNGHVDPRTGVIDGLASLIQMGYGNLDQFRTQGFSSINSLTGKEALNLALDAPLFHLIQTKGKSAALEACPDLVRNAQAVIPMNADRIGNEVMAEMRCKNLQASLGKLSSSEAKSFLTDAKNRMGADSKFQNNLAEEGRWIAAMTGDFDLALEWNELTRANYQQSHDKDLVETREAEEKARAEAEQAQASGDEEKAKELLATAEENRLWLIQSVRLNTRVMQALDRAGEAFRQKLTRVRG